MDNSVGVFGFVWKCLEIFDLDGHNLGTVLFLQILISHTFSDVFLK